MATRTEPRTLLFVDVSSSTALYARHGDEGGRRALIGIVAVLRRIVEAGGGTVVDQIGDELMCLFEEPALATSAAVSLQLGVASERELEPWMPVSIRIGLHHGPVLLDGERVFGDSVHLARRVASAAKPQQILTTRATAHAVPVGRQQPTRFFDEIHVKGRSDPVELVEIVWDTTLATSMVELRAPARRADAKLVIRHADEEVELGSSRPVLTVGRGEHCDLMLEHRSVSRSHGRFEYRKGRFVYVDQSTNGSWVRDAGGSTTLVHKDEVSLDGSGSILLGPAEEGTSPELAYRVEPLDPNGPS
jgi:class 3 adenylate cyclase